MQPTPAGCFVLRPVWPVHGSYTGWCSWCVVYVDRVLVMVTGQLVYTPACDSWTGQLMDVTTNKGSASKSQVWQGIRTLHYVVSHSLHLFSEESDALFYATVFTECWMVIGQSLSVFVLIFWCILFIVFI